MAQQEPTRKRTGPPGPSASRDIPDKLYFRIGEVARLCEVPAYVLRFWESEFPQLKPNKGGTGQRLYRRRDVEMALRVKTLLYDEGYTIAGARQAFKAELRSSRDPQLALAGSAPGTPGEPSTDTVSTHHLLALQKDLRELHTLLSRPAGAKSTTPRSSVQAIRAPRPVPAPKPPSPPPTPFPKAAPAVSRPSFTLFDSLPDPGPEVL